MARLALRGLRAHFALGLCLVLTSFVHADDWPQWRGPQRDGVWRETGIVEKFDSPNVPLRWTVPIGSGYSGPTVAAGRVYVTDRVAEPKELERVHCFDITNGNKIWSYEYPCGYGRIGYPAGPRASVSIDEGKAYSLGAAGHLICFDAVSGQLIWQHDLGTEYQVELPIWGIAASPLVDGELVIVQIGGADNACVVAFDKRDGKEKWRALPDRASYSAPIIITQAGKRVLVCWTGDNVVGLNPATGKVYWEYPFKPVQMVIGIATPVIADDKLFVTSFYDGSLMLRLDPDKTAVTEVWHRRGANERQTDGLHSIITTPYMTADYVYGVDSYGELRCLRADNGERVWESLKAVPKARWSTIHLVQNGDRMWMFNERGELIIAKLTGQGYEEISRTKLIEPTEEQLRQRGGVCWAHPAFAERCVFARNDNSMVCASLAAP